ncbi:2-hydroxyacid dehydrogenase [Micromonospora okii]|uniref:2-hydroxyacid dehydrogenase n=1 Tax=Micromonospora okii TaxID=1182970 RepID=UPI001E429BD9|nr:NAD(P)-dependent oxidoreductase [Micromonospora okii]
MTTATNHAGRRIVYLDEPTYITAGFLARLAALGPVKVHYDRPTPAETTHRLAEADIVIVEWTALTRAILQEARHLRHIATVLSATDQVDLSAAREFGITVSHCPGYSVAAVADHIMACSGALRRRLLPAHAAGSSGIQHSYVPYLGREPRGLVLGLLGTGRIGRAVAAIAAQHGVRVIGTNRSGTRVPGVDIVPLAELVRHSDILSVQVPATPTNRHLLSADFIDELRPGAVVVSVSRHAVIDTEALLRRHRTGTLGGVALDDAPIELVPALAAVANTLLTPGTAWYTERARQENLHEVLGNVRSHLTGGRRNVVT